MKSYIRLRKMIAYYLVVYMVVMAVLFFTLFSFFIGKWGLPQYLVVIGVTLGMIILFTLIYFFNYYEINRKYVMFVRFNKKYIYHYNDVVYIDEKQSEKRHVVCFYTNKGHTRYLIFDRKNVLYPTMLKHCQNRLTSEKFKEKYPNVAL